MGGGFVKRYKAARFSGGTLTGVLEEALEDMVGLSLSGASAIGDQMLVVGSRIFKTPCISESSPGDTFSSLGDNRDQGISPVGFLNLH
jgi:hypothetical protein